MFAFDAQQALGFLISQTSGIEAQAYEIQYPDIQYPALVPVDTSANPWAKSVTFFSTDTLGQAEWFHHQAKDLPMADVERSQHEHPVEMAAAVADGITRSRGNGSEYRSMILRGRPEGVKPREPAAAPFVLRRTGVACRGRPLPGRLGRELDPALRANPPTELIHRRRDRAVEHARLLGRRRGRMPGFGTGR